MIIILKSKKREYTGYSIEWGLFSSLLIFLLFYFLKSPELAADSVRASLNTCATRLVPSLFPFIVLVSMINSSGLSDTVSGVIGAPIARIFKISKNTASAVFLGALGGFPIGAVCARSLYERGEISRDDAARLISFTNNASPAFCIGAVGVSFFGDATFGIMLYICQLTAAVIIAVLSGNRRSPQKTAIPTVAKRLIADTVTSAITEGGVTMLKICSFAVFFAVVGDCMCFVISHYLGNTLSAVCVSFVELTLAAKKCSALGGDISRVLCAFAIGFSGLSVHMQSASVLSSSGIPMKKYYVSKLVQGILTALFVFILQSLSLI